MVDYTSILIAKMVGTSSIMTVFVLFGFMWSFHALTQEERNIVVEFHNALRSNVDPPAANMEKMVRPFTNKLILHYK